MFFIALGITKPLICKMADDSNIQSSIFDIPIYLFFYKLLNQCKQFVLFKERLCRFERSMIGCLLHNYDNEKNVYISLLELFYSNIHKEVEIYLKSKILNEHKMTSKIEYEKN